MNNHETYTQLSPETNESKTCSSKCSTIIFDEYGDGRYEEDSLTGGFDTIKSHRHRTPLTLRQLIKKVKHSTIKPNYWFYGPTGCGKTYAAYLIAQSLGESGPYRKALSQYWRQYHNEKVVLIDDVKPGDAIFFEKFLKMWGDNYPFTGKIDTTTSINAHVQAQTKIEIDPSKYCMIIASNYKPEDVIRLEGDDLNKFNRLFVPINITPEFMRGYLPDNSDDDYKTSEIEENETVQISDIKHVPNNESKIEQEKSTSTLESSSSEEDHNVIDIENIFISSEESDNDNPNTHIEEEKQRSQEHEERMNKKKRKTTLHKESEDDVQFECDDDPFFVENENEETVTVQNDTSKQSLNSKGLRVYHEKRKSKSNLHSPVRYSTDFTSKCKLTSQEIQNMLIDSQVNHNTVLDRTPTIPLHNTIDDRLKEIQEQIKQLELERTKLENKTSQHENLKRKSPNDDLISFKKKILLSEHETTPELPQSLLSTGK